MGIAELKLAQHDWKQKNPIKIYRQQNRLTQSQLASSLDVGIMSLQRWETGITDPNFDSLDKLEQVIGGDFLKDWNKWRAERPTL